MALFFKLQHIVFSEKAAAAKDVNFSFQKARQNGFNNGELECTWPRDLGYVDPSCRELEHF